MTTTTRSVALGVGVALVIIAGVFGYQYFSTMPAGERYTNEEYGFSFAVPEGFVVREIANVIVVDNEMGEGVQVVMTPIGEDILALTEERIRADIPDFVIEEPQVVEIEGGRKGLAFASDSEAFDGASREVWFVHSHNLYQISTYERSHTLLLSILGTWDFF